MKAWGSDTGGTTKHKPLVNARVIKRAKILMFVLVAPLGLLAILDFGALRIGERFNIAMTWLTVIAVAAYSIETYELRKSAENQVKLQRKLTMNEFLPIIVPSGEGFIRGSTLELNVINCGKGVAKDIRVILHNSTIAKAMAILSDGLPVTLRADQNNEVIRLATKDAELPEISIDIVYRDIYQREMRTNGIRFKLDTAGKNARYVLRRTGWEFENTDDVLAEPEE